MKIPHSGRVIVIDDKMSEAAPLLRALAKQGVPVAYFTGTEADELPTEPPRGTRVVFVDIVLGTEGQSSKTKISVVMGVLKRLIGPQNGPYIVVAWTKHPDEIEALREGLSRHDPAPMKLLDLQKISYMEPATEEGERRFKHDAVSMVEKKLDSELEKVGALAVLLAWEDLVHDAASGVTHDLYSLVPHDENWNRNASGVFRGLADAYAGKQLSPGDVTEVAQNALRTLTGVHVDALESLIGRDERVKNVTGLDLNASFDDTAATAKLNARLALADVVDSDPVQPGDLFGLGCNDFDIEISRHIKSSCKSDVRFVVLEVSPPCDYAQAKWLRHRLLPGFLWRHPRGGKPECKNPLYGWKSDVLDIDGEPWLLIFDLRCLTSKKLHDIPGRRLRRVRRGTLADIQAKLAYHISRPGVISLR